MSRSDLYKIARTSLWAGLILLALGGPYYLWSSGYIDRKIEDLYTYGHSLVTSTGFRVDDVVVEGRVLTSQEDILNILKVHRGDSPFKFSLTKIKSALEKLPWIRSVTLQRHLPDTLYIRLCERRPVALWQNEGKLYLVDDQGHIMENTPDYPQGGLLVLTGEDAFKKANVLIGALAEFPEVYHRVTGALFISKRRWDIILDHKFRLKLSETDLRSSLEAFSKLTQDLKLEEKDIIGVDLRFKDRTYFQLSPEAVGQKKKNTGKNT